MDFEIILGIDLRKGENTIGSFCYYTIKVANHVVSMIGFTDLQDQCSDITGKGNRSYLS